MTYQIVTAEVTSTMAAALTALTSSVNTQLTAGYTCQGGVLLLNDVGRERQILAQAMTHS